MTIELNTSLVRWMFSGTYETQWEPEELDDDGMELEISYDFGDLMRSIAHEYQNFEEKIQRDLNISFVKKIHFTGGTFSPREYNFSTDSLDFTIEAEIEEVLTELDKLQESQEFATFLTENYRSRDGFISFTPCTFAELREEIATQGDHFEQSIAALMQYLTVKETLEDIEEMVYDSWQGNGYGGLEYKTICQDCDSEIDYDHNYKCQNTACEQYEKVELEIDGQQKLEM